MEKRLTDNEIVKALECCGGLTSGWCDKCPMNVTKECEKDLSALEKLALDLINRLQAENERLRNAYKQCAWERDNFQADNERLYGILENKGGLILTKTAKAEAYKECIEKVKKLRGNYTGYAFDRKLDNLLKEMVGDDK